jgi:AcrR family transcriptional regulator
MMEGESTRRNELLLIALDVLERDGLQHFSIGEVARASNIKTPSLYKHFDNKADLEARLIQLGLRWQGEAYSEAIESLGAEPGRREFITAMAHAFRAFGIAHPQLYRLINDRRLPPERPSSDQYRSARQVFLESFPTPAIGLAVWSWAHGLLSVELAGNFLDDVDPADLWDVAIEMMIGND